MCLTILQSKTRHDFQSCKCINKAFVDGGDSYTRQGAKYAFPVLAEELVPVPSKSRLRRLSSMTQGRFEDEKLLRIIIKINNRTIYNVQATRTNFLDDDDVGDYDVVETVRGLKFNENNYPRERGALELAWNLLGKLMDKEKRLK
jgi:hypothetical protein